MEPPLGRRASTWYVPQLLPYERACEVLEDLLGPSMSVGTRPPLVERCAQQLAPVEQQIKAALSRAEVLHQDETGLYVAGQRQWMHVSATEHLTRLSRACQTR
jgi:transposase